MSDTRYTLDDPRLTAYVLGELDAAEAAPLERELALSPELRGIVDEIRTTTTNLFAALQAEETPAGARRPLQPLPLATPTPGQPASSRRVRRTFLLANLVTLSLLAAVVIALQSAGDPPGTVATRGPSHQDAWGTTALHDGDMDALGFDWSAVGAAASEHDGEELRQLVSDSKLARQKLNEAQTPERGTSLWMRDSAASFQQQSGEAAPLTTQWSDAGLTHEAKELSDKLGVTFRTTVDTFSVQPNDPKGVPWSKPDPALPTLQTPASGPTSHYYLAPTDSPAALVAGGSQQGVPGQGQQTQGQGQQGQASGLQILSASAGQAGNGQQPASREEQLSKLRQLAGQNSGPVSRHGWSSVSSPAAESQPYRRDGATPLGTAASEAEVLARGVSARYRQTPLQLGGTIPQYQADGTRLEWRAADLESQRGEQLGERRLLERARSMDLYESLHGGESYAPVVENDFIVPTGEAALSTFGLDVDTASYANVRRFLSQNQLPPPDAVRIEELVNYFDYDLPQPEGNEPFSVSLEATSCPWKPKHRLVRVALQGREIDVSQRPLTRLVFLLDVSGSMQDAKKLPLVKDSMKLLVEQLNENDRIAIVTYAGDAGLKLDSTSGDDKPAILAAIDSLSAGGSTNGAGGIRLAYEVATKHFLDKGSNRIILCTDGDFNVGVSSDDELVKMIEQKRESGVFLSILGYGMGNIKDSKLEGLADKGNGTYGYIDDLKEARKVFVEELTGTLYTIAKDVKLQVEFNPAKVGAYRLLGYENRLLAAEDFNNDKVDAGDMGAGHSVTALYEIAPVGEWAAAAEQAPVVDELKYQPVEESGVRSQESGTDRLAATREESEAAGAASNELLTVKVRYKQPDGDESVKREFPLVDDPAKCSQETQWTAAVTGFGLLLRNSKYAADMNWDLVLELADSGKGDDVNGRRAEFIDLARHARRLWEIAYPSERIRRQLSAVSKPIEGVVMEVSRGKFVLLSCGSDDGVTAGSRLKLFRPAEQPDQAQRDLGFVRVIDLLSDRCVGELIEQSPGATIELGDRIDSRP